MNIAAIGEKLKNTRIERGITLEEARKKTKIHLNVLRAIEGDTLSDLSPVYLKSFIKIYCSYLGIDFKDCLGETQKLEKKPVLFSKVGRDIGGRPEKKKKLINDTGLKLSVAKSIPKLKKIIALILIIAIVIFVIVALAGLFSKRVPRNLTRKNISISKIQPKKEIKSQKNIAVISSKEKAPAVKQVSKAQKEASGGFVVGILAKDKCWVVIKTDGRTAFQGMLQKGRFESWKANTKAELTLGDAGAVELQVNDQRFPNLGPRGKALKNILINKDGLKISR